MPTSRPAYTTDPLTPLSVRIGVTGHRPNKLPADFAALTNTVEQIIADIVRIAEAFCQDKDAELLYTRQTTRPVLTVVSPLAEGADRLVAKVAGAAGFSLIVPVPFAINEYEQDFEPGRSLQDPENGTIPEFRELMEGGQVVVLDGSHASMSSYNLAYQNAGLFTVAHSDLVIAVWDGSPAEGASGTGEIVDHARRNGVPVIHVHPDQAGIDHVRLFPPAKPEWPSLTPLRDPEPYQASTLQGILEARFLPHSMFATCADRLDDFAKESGFKTDGSDPDYVYKGPLTFSRRRQWLGNLFEIIRNAVVPRSNVRKHLIYKPVTAIPLPECADHQAADHYFAAYLRADSLAIHYSGLNRSTFVSIYLLGGFAIAFAVGALAFKEASIHLFGAVTSLTSYLVAVEFVLLAIIGGLVFQDRKRRWHEKWLDYRLLSEMFRPMSYLALVGATVPLDVIRHISSQVLGPDETGTHVRGRHQFRTGAWVFAYFESVVRSAGVVSATFDEGYRTRCKEVILNKLIRDQLYYHDSNAIRSGLFDHRLAVASTFLFFATIAVVATKLVFGLPGVTGLFALNDKLVLSWLGFLAATLPAGAAACYAVRSHAELEIVARRSEVMRARLKTLSEHISSLQGNALTSTALAAVVRQAADAMVHDVADWVDIFEVKETEAA